MMKKKNKISLLFAVVFLLSLNFVSAVCISDDDCPVDGWKEEGGQYAYCYNEFNLTYNIWDIWLDNYCDTEFTGECQVSEIPMFYSDCPQYCVKLDVMFFPQCIDFNYVIIDGIYAPINGGNYSSDFNIINFSSAFNVGYPLDLHTCGWNATCSYSVNGVIGTTQYMSCEGGCTGGYTLFQPPFENVKYKYGNNTMRVWCNGTLNASEVDCSLTYNSSGEYVSVFFYNGEFNLTATSVNPANNTQTTGDLINFTANLYCNDTGGCNNSTLYFFNSSDTYSVFTNLAGINNTQLGNEINLSQNLSNGIYVWYYDVRDVYNHLNTSEQRTIIVNITFPSEPPQEELSYLSSPIYQTLNEVGAGVYFLLFGTSQGIGVLLIAIIIISVIAVVGYSIAKIIPNMMKNWQNRK